MSIASSSCAQIRNAPTNNSKSKQTYAFSKSPRFQGRVNTALDSVGYDLPPTRDKRSASFGYGTKFDFTKGKLDVPAPNSYKTASDFDKNRPYGKPQTFGKSRENCQIVLPKGQYIADLTIPSPGKYYPVPEFGSDGKKWSFLDRSQKKHEAAAQAREANPGPGKYYQQLGKIPGHSYLSKFKNPSTPNFAPRSSGRFGLVSRAHLQTPGPGSYATRQELGNSPVLSQHRSTLRNMTQKSPRNQLDMPHDSTPGPGSYRLPSEFGHYDNPVMNRQRSQPNLQH